MLFITSKIWCFLHRLWDLQVCYLLLGRQPHTEAAQVACCGLRTCCIGWGRIPAGLSKKSTVSVIWSNEVWCCIRRSLPWTLQIYGTKKDIFFWQTSELWIWLNSAQHGKYMLCSTFWLDRPLLWSARHCSAPSLLRDGCKEQNTPYCFKNPNLDCTNWEMKVSRMVTQKWSFLPLKVDTEHRSHIRFAGGNKQRQFALCLPLLSLQNQISGRAQQPSLPCESKELWTFPSWGMSPCPEWLCAHAVSYSCAVLSQRRGL